MNDKNFNSGDSIWIVERDEDGEACEVSGVVFLAAVKDYAICSPTINGNSSVKTILEYHAAETRTDYDSHIPVYRLLDCYATREEAHAALDRENEQDADN